MSPRKRDSKRDRSPSKNSDHPARPERSGARPASPKKGEFRFTDRSGKVHDLTRGKGAHSAAPRPYQIVHGESAARHPKKPVRENRFESRSRDSDEKDYGSGNGSRGSRYKATVDKNHKGFAFLIFENRRNEDAFVPPHEASSLFHGDRVEVTLTKRGQVTGLTVLEHRFRELVGRFEPHPSQRQTKSGWVVYERKRAREEVFVPEAPAGIKPGDWVQASLEFHDSGPHPVTARITENYGELLPAWSDIRMVAAEYNLIEKHTEAAEREAKAYSLDLDLQNRVDMRNTPFITIDGETARDFDDAVYVERNGTGYVLWVAIADVSHYVKPGTSLDQEARSRGTSVYFPERAFHMLPRALSENLCSLRPSEPRLAFVARMEMDAGGQRHKTELFEAVIESKRRATYNEIQAEWEKNASNPDWEYRPHFDLFKQLRKLRSKRGSIDFDLPEAELKVGEDGEPTSIKERARQDAHRLIEEFMIGANEAVTDWMMERAWPFIYRIHDEPTEEKIDRFLKLASNVGVHAKLSEGDLAQALSDLVRRIDGHPAQALLNMMLLRSMKQAVYSSTHGIHFGLASQGYTHFTSPIRRYPDLVVHRMLRLALRTEQKKNLGERRPSREELERELADIAEHCSYRERIAADAERESIRLKQVRFMISKVGEEFEGRVIGMADPGLFIMLKDPFVEGMIPKDTMNDDSYEYSEERMIFFGRRKRKTFRIGDDVKIQVVKADLDRRQVDFALLEHHPRAVPTEFSAPPESGKSGGKRGGRTDARPESHHERGSKRGGKKKGRKRR